LSSTLYKGDPRKLTSAGLLTGVPSIRIPFFGDQLFWGKPVEELGVGLAPISQKRLTAERLTQAIHDAIPSVDMGCQATALVEIQARTESDVW
jgi:hypothetical protein